MSRNNLFCFVQTKVYTHTHTQLGVRASTNQPALYFGSGERRRRARASCVVCMSRTVNAPDTATSHIADVLLPPLPPPPSLPLLSLPRPVGRSPRPLRRRTQKRRATFSALQPLGVGFTAVRRSCKRVCKRIYVLRNVCVCAEPQSSTECECARVCRLVRMSKLRVRWPLRACVWDSQNMPPRISLVVHARTRWTCSP